MALAALTIAAVLLLAAALIAVRALLLARSRGTIICRLRTAGSGWRRGVARYAGGELHWIPFFAVRLRPRHAIARRGLEISSRRRLDGIDGPKGYWAVDCGAVTLAMSEDALTGFLAWLEAAPPSAHLLDHA
ncbi:hypothetical protein GCM10010106_35750 [Thermopolyspora flexuosa]|uniref:Uncharacterized protein DUF2550 n=1 Tax=Thermopolyspora flexuosa TaxID=103836 RepID=A0A543J1C9_9ACTN|nr:DUF2550 domain-containing protein [Thermopolyspora flexuosa]TQM76629.1 uncharacterized protein DUF2550 [Thermopolyspora flexuosa]GGM85572.1 hypothetical protein GCM10010106_35750 [Thermopolyspora flexuosa]